MKIFKLIYVLYKMGLLSPLALYRLTASVSKYGVNLMTLLSFAVRTYGNKIALVEEDETITYKELLDQSQKLSLLLQKKYHLKSGMRVGLLSKNHASLIKTIFAVSLSGADIFFLNAEISSNQFNRILESFDFDLLVFDHDLTSLVDGSNYSKDRLLSCHNILPGINNLLNEGIDVKTKIHRTYSGKIVLLTSGTTGNFKTAIYKPSLFNFLNPFTAVLTRLKLLNYNTAYIATPIYHGYGFAVLLLFLALGKKVVINNGFETEKACSLICENKVEVIIAVPLIIHKLLMYNTEALKSLACIASGGTELNTKLLEETLSRLGDVLYNLYGTSEAGLNIIATPEDLKYASNTIGRKIKGVQLKILDDNKKEVKAGQVGQFCIKNKWSMKNNVWIETGDLGYRDKKGYYFLCGRVDDMVVSAGENVYPIEVEQVLKKHPKVEDAAVIGISDELFGQRLKAFVLISRNSSITKEELLDWLCSKIARFQIPRDIIFVDNLPYTSLGKLDKKQLEQ